MRSFRNATKILVRRTKKRPGTIQGRFRPIVTGFIQHGGQARLMIPQRRESSPVSSQGPRVATRAGAWRVGGLLGALVYSVVCWTLVYHGAKSVIAWMGPEPRIEASAAEAPPPFTPPAAPLKD
ncbi:MAG: hypothetical protein NW200_02075 [Hyphomonadaceae bacterium]|nr:hypothetical protein [Hyphomonadaceae bacterium]